MAGREDGQPRVLGAHCRVGERGANMLFEMRVRAMCPTRPLVIRCDRQGHSARVFWLEKRAMTETLSTSDDLFRAISAHTSQNNEPDRQCCGVHKAWPRSIARLRR